MQVMKRVQFLALCRSSLHAMHAAYETMYSNFCSVCIFALGSLIICFKSVIMSCVKCLFSSSQPGSMISIDKSCRNRMMFHYSAALCYAQVSTVYVTSTGPPAAAANVMSKPRINPSEFTSQVEISSTQCSCHGQEHLAKGSCWTSTHAEASVPKDQNMNLSDFDFN